MSVLFIDGWDIHSRVAGADLPGMEDYGMMFYSNPTVSLSYVSGYLSGQGIRQSHIPQLGWGSTAGTNGNSIPAGQDTLRVSWFAKVGTTSITAYNIWYGFMMLLIEGTYYGVQINQFGNTRIARGGFFPGLPIFNPADTTEEIMSGSSTTVLSGAWTFYEFYANFPTNTFELRINGDLECSGSLDIPKPNVDGVVKIAFNHPQNFNTDLDHLIVTDGESLVGTNKIHAIAPTAAYGGTFATLRGNLVKNGASYQTLHQRPIVEPDSITATNAENVAYFLYPRDPTTGLAWGTDVLTGLQGWGVCAGDFGSGSDYINLTALGLSLVQTTSDPNGFPIINILSPAGLTYLSGGWVKSHPNSTIAGHLNDIPRTVLRSEDKYLVTQVDGCILFAPTSVDPLLQTLGITFAEEYREDFTDWYQLVVGGIPFESYFITGYTILGNGDKNFQSNYVSVNYENVPVGGAYLQGVWDYSLSGTSGRWGTKQQIYRLTSANYKYQVSKLKVRGHGTSMQIKVTSQEGKDFRLSGWTIAASGNTSV